MDLNQARFIIGVSAATKIDPRVLVAWVQAEGAYAQNGTGGFNYLNLRPAAGDVGVSHVTQGNFDNFTSVNAAITSTVNRLRNPFAAPILATARTKPTPAQQINAIASTGWDSGHYGGNGGVNLVNIYTSLFKNPNDHYLDPSNARGVVNTAGTGSAATGASYDANNAVNDVTGAAGTAANYVVNQIPGVKEIRSIGDAIGWIGNNWDRIAWVVGGTILVLLGFVLLGGKAKATAMSPVKAKG